MRPRKRPAAHQRDGRERAEHGRGARRQERDAQADTRAESIRARSAQSSAYQRVDQPPQTVTSREALKE